MTQTQVKALECPPDESFVRDYISNMDVWGNSKRGLYSHFISLNDDWGVKLTRSKERRDDNYARQAEAARHGLGPEVGVMVDVEDCGGNIYYGYVTEIVKVCSHYTIYHNINMFRMFVNNLCRQLEDIMCWDFCDCHEDNVGFKNGNMVCIDFDADFSS